MDEAIWYEKYRPKSFDDMVLPEEQLKAFKGYLEKSSIPHLLLYGPQGSGKTTTAKILMEGIKCHTLELNASSGDRGIDTMKGKVKNFAASQPLPGKIKVVFMDEADGLTADAMLALKNTIEKYHKSCRFLLTANHVDKIIPEIRSRFIQLYFKPLSPPDLEEYLKWILDEEEITYTDKTIKAVVDKTFPDIRSLMNSAQICSTDGTLNLANLSSDITLGYEELEKFMNLGKLFEIRSGVAGTTNFTPLYRYLFDEHIQNLKEPYRPTSAVVIAEYMYRDNIVSDKEVNFAACIVELLSIRNIRIQF